MKRILSFLFLFGAFTSIAQSHSKSVLDTMVFDLANATTTTTSGTTYSEFPVYAITTGGISSFDFWFQFNQTELTYVSTTSLVTGLDAFSNFNQANFYLSNTTSGSSINFNIPINVPVVKLTFQLSAACNLINSQDFSNITTLFDGIVSSHKITAPVPSQIQVTSPLPTCTNNDITFTYDAFYAGKPISTYDWNFGNGNSSNLQTDATQYGSPGSYTITLDVTTQDACVYTLTFPIEMMQGPIASFSTATGASQTEVIFTNTSTFSAGSITQNAWDFGDGNTSNLENPTHDFPGADTYPVTLTVTADNGCSNTVVGNVSTVGLEQTTVLPLIMYPNPTSGLCTLELPNGIDQIWIMQNDGKIIKRFDDLMSVDVIDLTNLAPGMYILCTKDQRLNFIKL